MASVRNTACCQAGGQDKLYASSHGVVHTSASSCALVRQAFPARPSTGQPFDRFLSSCFNAASPSYVSVRAAMNAEAARMVEARQEEVRRLGGLAAYRLHALQNLKLKVVVKVWGRGRGPAM